MKNQKNLHPQNIVQQVVYKKLHNLCTKQNINGHNN